MHILLTYVHLDCGGRVPVTGMLAGMNLSKPGMNLSKPGIKHNNHVIIVYNHYFWFEQKWDLRLSLRKNTVAEWYEKHSSTRIVHNVGTTSPETITWKGYTVYTPLWYHETVVMICGVYLRTLVPEASTVYHRTTYFWDGLLWVYQTGVRNCIPQ